MMEVVCSGWQILAFLSIPFYSIRFSSNGVSLISSVQNSLLDGDKNNLAVTGPERGGQNGQRSEQLASLATYHLIRF